ncbi:MAG: hypothetical protein ACAI44_39765 [Candidatus Sericytochromatia bacterium]
MMSERISLKRILMLVGFCAGCILGPVLFVFNIKPPLDQNVALLGLSMLSCGFLCAFSGHFLVGLMSEKQQARVRRWLQIYYQHAYRDYERRYDRGYPWK